MITVYILVHSICFTNDVYIQTLSVKKGLSLTLDDHIFSSQVLVYIYADLFQLQT
jgi:hypothetical protein